MFEITDAPDEPTKFEIGDVVQIIDVSPAENGINQCPYQLNDILVVTGVSKRGFLAFFGEDFCWKPERFRLLRKRK